MFKLFNVNEPYTGGVMALHYKCVASMQLSFTSLGGDYARPLGETLNLVYANQRVGRVPKRLYHHDVTYREQSQSHIFWFLVSTVEHHLRCRA